MKKILIALAMLVIFPAALADESGADLLRNPDVVVALISTGGAVVVGIVAIFKGGDLLQVFRQRKIYRLRAKLQRTCPHAEFSLVGELPQVSLLLVSPSGTTNYYCQLCNSMAREYDVGKLSAYWKSIGFEELMRALKNSGKARKLRTRLDSMGNWASE